MKLKWTCIIIQSVILFAPETFTFSNCFSFKLIICARQNFQFSKTYAKCICEIIRGLLFCLLTWWSSFCLEIPQFTNKPPPKVVVEQATTVSLCCVATGSPRPKVEWTRHQRSTLFSPFFQEDGCLAVNTAKAHGEEDYICRATNSFGLTETVTTVIATKLMGIITVITFITFQLYIQNTFPLYVFFYNFFFITN